MTRQSLSSVITTSFFITAIPLAASADTIFYDDFTDGSLTNNVPVAADGTPVRWTEGASNPSVTTLDASSGDLIMSTEDYIAAGGPGDFSFYNTSIRTQVRRIDDRHIIGIGVHRSPTSNNGYSAGFGSSGGIFVSLDSSTQDPQVLQAVATNLNPTHEDLILQFDLIGSTLKVWAWRPSEQMPAYPQISIYDNTYSEGIINLFVGSAFSTGYKEGTFRYVYAANTHIPEFPADFDADGDVDGNDFLVWQRSESLSSVDLALWETQFGTTSAFFSSTAIPEPSTWLLLLLGISSVVIIGRRYF